VRVASVPFSPPLQLPPEQIADAIKEYAEQCGLDFVITV